MEKLPEKSPGEFGWVPLGMPDPSLVADVASHPRFGAGRIWSRPSTYVLKGVPKRIYLVHTMEGGIDFTFDGVNSGSTDPGQLVLIDGEVPTFAHTRGDTARYVWHLNPTFLDPVNSKFAFREPMNVSNAAMRALMSTTNSIVSAAAPTGPATRAHLGIAIEHLIAGALSESGTLAHASDALHRDGLFTTARRVIDARFSDPGFGVAQLEKALSVGSTTLHNAFQSLGTTPRREIERRRVSEATRLQQQALTLPQVIERSGFTSVRQYQRALGRPPLHHDGDETQVRGGAE